MMPMVTGFGLARLMTANRQNENILNRNEATQKFAPFTPSATEKAILGRVAEAAEYFEREFAAGFVPSGLSPEQNERERARTVQPRCSWSKQSVRWKI
jgi:hypothetical protein